MKQLQFNQKIPLDQIKQDKINYQLKKQRASFDREQIDKLHLVPKDYSNSQIMNTMKDKNIFMSLNIPPPVVTPDKHVLYLENNIVSIINVYQPEYKDFTKATGFGDFIRGSYFLMQFCEQYNIEYDICINHPISKWLMHHKQDEKSVEEHVMDILEDLSLIHI